MSPGQVEPQGRQTTTGAGLDGMAEQMKRTMDNVPARIGPAEFGRLGALITVRCPHDFDHLMRGAGGQWDPGNRHWLIERRRINPLVRALRRHTDPLFRQAGISLDEV